MVCCPQRTASVLCSWEQHRIGSGQTSGEVPSGPRTKVSLEFNFRGQAQEVMLSPLLRIV